MGTIAADQGIMTLVTVVIVAICVALALYVLYSVIWHAVRRGMREYHRTTTALRVPTRADLRVPNYPPSEWVSHPPE